MLMRTLLRLATALVLALTAVAALPPRPAAADDGSMQLAMNGWVKPKAEVDVVLTANPNLTVPAGSTLTYQVIVNNRGDGDAWWTWLTFPLDAAKVQLLDVTTTRSNFWVTAVAANQFTMEAGRLTPGDVVTATVRLRTLAALPTGTELMQHVTFDAPDNDPLAPRQSNHTLVTIGSTAQSQAILPLYVSPWLAPVGRTLSFTSPAFQPGELVTFWYSDSTPDETFVETIRTGDDGMLMLMFNSGDLRPGFYTMLAHGQNSGLTGRVTFQIQPNLGTVNVTINPDGSVTWLDQTYPTGDLQATLIWNSSVDLNLLVMEPSGAMAAVTGGTSTTATVSSSNSCSSMVVSRPEHFVWPAGAPRGNYTFWVEYAGGCGVNEDTPFTLRVVANGVEQIIGGTIGPDDARQSLLGVQLR
jgi:hypothetical protein